MPIDDKTKGMYASYINAPEVQRFQEIKKEFPIQEVESLYGIATDYL